MRGLGYAKSQVTAVSPAPDSCVSVKYNDQTQPILLSLKLSYIYFVPGVDGQCCIYNGRKKLICLIRATVNIMLEISPRWLLSDSSDSSTQAEEGYGFLDAKNSTCADLNANDCGFHKNFLKKISLTFELKATMYGDLIYS